MKRIQRKRTKGWKMPEGAIYVGRGSVYGNPFSIQDFPREDCVAMFRRRMARRLELSPEVWRPRLEALRGHLLVCWCRPDQICHAEVWFELLGECEEK